MGFLGQVRAAAALAAVKAREGVADLRAKRELGQAYGELGRIAFELVESGEISHPRLEPAAGRIRGVIEARAAGAPASDAAAAAAAEPDEAGEPPATPSE